VPWLDDFVQLPAGYKTSRRDAFKFLSLAAALTSVGVGLVRAKVRKTSISNEICLFVNLVTLKEHGCQFRKFERVCVVWIYSSWTSIPEESIIPGVAQALQCSGRYPAWHHALRCAKLQVLAKGMTCSPRRAFLSCQGRNAP
jgi:hypothetical protein